jgi:hypothetical protein
MVFSNCTVKTVFLAEQKRIVYGVNRCNTGLSRANEKVPFTLQPADFFSSSLVFFNTFLVTSRHLYRLYEDLILSGKFLLNVDEKIINVKFVCYILLPPAILKSIDFN